MPDLFPEKEIRKLSVMRNFSIQNLEVKGVGHCLVREVAILFKFNIDNWSEDWIILYFSNRYHIDMA